MKTVAPGAQFQTSAFFATSPTSPGVRLMAADGTTTIARSTVGIVSQPGNTRSKLLTAPGVVGWYLPMWDDNSGTPFPDEDVLVTQTAVATVATASTVLTSSPSEFWIKQHDTREPLSAQIVEDDGTIVNLTGVTTTRFLMRAAGAGAPKVNDTTHTTVTNAVQGLVMYQWQPADTDTVAVYNAEFEFTFSDGRVLTAPTRTYIVVHVVADLGP